MALLNKGKILFHTLCLVGEKEYVVVVDGSSCANLVSSTLVEELNIRYTKHPKPYNLQCVNECGELRVNKQALVSFEMGR